MNGINYEQKSYLNYAKNAVKIIKQLDDEITKKESDLIKFGQASSRCNLETDQLDSQMKIYVTYLGYLDALIFTKKGEIDCDWSRNLYKDENLLKEYLNQRHKVLGVIEHKMVYRKMVDNIDEILEEVPSFTKFNLIYDKVKHDNLMINNHNIEFITCYNIGFMKKYGYSYEFMTSVYETSCAEIDINHSKNVKKLAKAKTLKRKN